MIHRFIEERNCSNFQRPQNLVLKITLELRDSFNKWSYQELENQVFDGQPDFWKTFFDNFKCAIDQSSSLKNIQKVRCLKRLLRSSAEQVISSFKLSNENYTSAINLSREGFDSWNFKFEHLWIIFERLC